MLEASNIEAARITPMGGSGDSEKYGRQHCEFADRSVKSGGVAPIREKLPNRP